MAATRLGLYELLAPQFLVGFTFPEHGLTLDGATDVVLTDTDLVDGVCPTLRDFRRSLVADRLGVAPTVPSTFGTMPDPTFVRLADGVEAFHAIRERLVAGGLGRVERLWSGTTPGLTPVTPLDQRLADPDGEEFDLLGTLAFDRNRGAQLVLSAHSSRLTGTWTT